MGDVEQLSFVELDHSSTDWRSVTVEAVCCCDEVFTENGLTCAAPDFVVERVVLVERISLLG